MFFSASGRERHSLLRLREASRSLGKLLLRPFELRPILVGKLQLVFANFLQSPEQRILLTRRQSAEGGFDFSHGAHAKTNTFSRV